MNLEDCNLSNVKIECDPVEWVVAAYNNFIQAKLICPLKADGILCGEAGTEVVSVYKFRGDFEQVFTQLSKHIEGILTEVPTEDLRDRIIQLVYAHIEYKETTRINPHYTAYINAKRSGDLMLMGELFGRYVEWNQRMHDNKQCLCFCN